MSIELSLDFAVKMTASGMTEGDLIMAENKYYLIERMGIENLGIGVDCANKKSVVFMGKA